MLFILSGWNYSTYVIIALFRVMYWALIFILRTNGLIMLDVRHWYTKRSLLKVHIKPLKFLFFCLEEPKRADKFFYNFRSITFVLEPYHFKITPICMKKSRTNEAWDSGTHRFHTTKKAEAFWSQTYRNAYISYNNHHVKLKLGLWHVWKHIFCFWFF